MYIGFGLESVLINVQESICSCVHDPSDQHKGYSVDTNAKACQCDTPIYIYTAISSHADAYILVHVGVNTHRVSSYSCRASLPY